MTLNRLILFRIYLIEESDIPAYRREAAKEEPKNGNGFEKEEKEEEVVFEDELEEPAYLRKKRRLF